MRRSLAAAARLPVVRFFALGAALALARGALSPSAGNPPRVIAVPPPIVERIAAASGDDADSASVRRAVDAWVDDEVLYREGLRRGLAWNPATIARWLQVGRFVKGAADGDANDSDVLAEVHELGLDREDPVVRSQVAGRMRLLLQVEASRREPTDAELAALLAAQRDRFARPARTTFSHVFVRRGPDAADRAAALAGRIARDGLAPGEAARLGDAFAPGRRFASRSRAEVEAVLGSAVAAAVLTAMPGSWSGPIASAYGWHLIQVEERVEERLPTLPEVRDAVRAAWRTEHARRAVAERVRALRAAYRIEIASDAPQVAMAAGSVR